MKRSNYFNNIEPNNSQQVRSTSSLIDKREYRRNNISTASAYKTDNYARAKTTKGAEIATKAKSISEVIKSFAVIVSSLMIGVVGIGLMPQKSNVRFDYIEAYDDGVYYEIILDEYEEGLKVVLKNDFTSREEEIKEQMWVGYFEGLEPNMYYTISIVKGLSTLAKEQVYTHYYEKEKPVEEDPITADDPVEEEPNTSDGPVQEEPNTSDNPDSGYIG